MVCIPRWCTKRRQTNRLRANGNWSPGTAGKKAGAAAECNQIDRPFDVVIRLDYFTPELLGSLLFFGPNEVIIHLSDWMKCAKMDRANASDKQTHNKVNGIVIVKSYRPHSPFIVGFIVFLPVWVLAALIVILYVHWQSLQSSIWTYVLYMMSRKSKECV